MNGRLRILFGASGFVAACQTEGPRVPQNPEVFCDDLAVDCNLTTDTDCLVVACPTDAERCSPTILRTTTYDAVEHAHQQCWESMYEWGEGVCGDDDGVRWVFCSRLHPY